MSELRFTFRLLVIAAFLLCFGLFAACKHPVESNDDSYTDPYTNPENPTENTLVKFDNLEQFTVTVYGDSSRNRVLTEIAALGSTVIAAEPAPSTPFYPTFRLDIFDIPGISIPYDGEAFVAKIEAHVTNLAPVPKLKSIALNSAYIKIVNNSGYSLTLNQGSGEKGPLGGGSTVINSGQSAAYDVFPGPISNYSILSNTLTPVAFPAELTEFKRGIIYVITYNGTNLSITDVASVLQTFPPAMPENVRTEVISRDNARITWNEVYGATSYRIYRAIGSPDSLYSLHANTTTPSWTDTVLTAGQIYSYKISALSGENLESEQSSEVFAVMPSGNIWINAITDSSVSLAWIDVSEAESYNVYRSDSENGTYTKVNHSAISGTEYTDTGLDPLTEYYYKISATTFGLEGILSSSVSCTTLMPAPANVQLTSVTDGSISFTWNAVNGASGYNIYRSSGANGIYAKVNSSVVTQVSYVDTGLSSNINYHYRVSAVTDSMESAQSSVLSVTTLLPVPGNLRITIVTDISVSLEWDAVGGASGYNVYRSASEDGAYARVNPVVTTAVSYTNSGISPDTNYYFKVCAVSSEGIEGVRSNAVSAATPISAPDNVRVTSVTDNTINLAWNAVHNASGYNLYRSNSANGTYSQINSSLITNVTYADTGLASNTAYYYKASVMVDGVESIHSNAISGATILPAPGNVRVTAVTDNSVNLEWNAVNGASGYNVYRASSENGSYSRINSSMITAVFYANTNVSSNTNYYYRVYAVSSGGIEGIPSIVVSCTTLMSAPGNVRVTSVTDNTINLAWNTATGASGYNVYRSSSASGTYIKLNLSLIFDVTYADMGLSSDTNYYYKMSAVAGDVEGVLSGVISGATLLPAPANVWVASVTDNSVSLEWNTVAGANGYNIYRSTSGSGTYTKVNSSMITAVSYTNTGVSSNTTYCYSVYAVSSGGIEGLPSTAVSGTTLRSAPGNLRVTSVTDNDINLAWNTVTGASGYNIYRSSSANGSYSKLNASLISDISYADMGLSSNTSYYYKVSVMVDDVEGVLSSAVSSTTLLSAPDNLRVTAVTDVSVSLEWNTLTGANGYNIYRSTSENGTYSKVNSSIITVISYTNTGVSSTTTYYYRVCAVSSGNVEGVRSAAISGTTLRAAPGNLRTTSATDSSVSLAWNTVNNASGYNVYRSIIENGTYTKLNSSLISVTSYTNTGLSSNTSYYYKVTVVVDGVESVQSGAISGTTLLVAPGGLNVTAVTDVTISLEWNSLIGASGYNLYRSTSENGTYTKVNSSVITVLSYTNTGVSPDATYYYRVCALSSGGIEGVQSSAVSVVTLMPAPGNMRVASVTDNSLSLAWNVVNGASGYNIYRSSSVDGTYTKLNTGALIVTEYTDTGFIPYSTIYYYKAKAVFSDGIEGMWSEPCSVMVPGNGLAAKLAWLQSNAISNNFYIVEVDTDENIGPQTLSYSGKSGITIILRGDGIMRTVNLSSNGSLLKINSGVTLTLVNNITLKGRSGNNVSNASLVYIDGGTLIMNGGEISGNSYFYSTYYGGGGVYVAGNGTCTMNGGEISGNSSYDGGGVYVAYDGTFTMNGGEISGNRTGSSGSGGGVSVRGTFTMNGGKISGNTATNSGGGVFVYSTTGTFTKTDNSIITGWGDDNGNGNVVKNSAGTVINNQGHAVYSSSTKKREKTVYSGENLDSAIDGTAGGWVDP